MDPITFSIIRHRLFRVIDEAVITLKQVSGSAITNEGHDLMVSLYRADGSLLMGGVGFLHHLTSAAEAARRSSAASRAISARATCSSPTAPTRRRSTRRTSIWWRRSTTAGGWSRGAPASSMSTISAPWYPVASAGFARYLHRRLQLARYQAGRGRGDAPRCDGYGAQHGARAGDGGARPLLHDRGQQCGAGADGRID